MVEETDHIKKWLNQREEKFEKIDELINEAYESSEGDLNLTELIYEINCELYELKKEEGIYKHRIMERAEKVYEVGELIDEMDSNLYNALTSTGNVKDFQELSRVRRLDELINEF